MSGTGWPALLLAAALLVWPPATAAGARRARSLVPSGGERPPHAGPGRGWLLPGAAGVGAALLVGGVGGVVTGAALAVAAHRLVRRTAGGAVDDGAAVTGDLPAACDLLAVCLDAGLPPSAALDAVGAAVPAPLGPALRRVAALYRLGAEPRRAWADVPVALAAAARVLVRAEESGSAAVPALRALAQDHRETLRARTEAAVRRAGIWVLAPLGLCFLPAFVCLGVVPLILGIAGDVFG
ncbi:type II secretion system F family protein [Blastococcus sp. PRF04-17]|uniref:type II secretion system F family protein n=1 Tax=Blastococcus sp. PRF04-17 TaxID=2933797 RepID=UPI001FF2ED1D|nr:type II secretion system F family protein [Blastococcus sp. PRF04-17]UOY00040.1 type II secretion system F family protein [Blastococcus sp. PRF04-17]